MGFTKDLWTRRVEGPDGKVTREPNARWGKGKRWLAVWHDESGREQSKAFPVKAAADKYWQGQETDVARGDYIDPKAGKETIAAVGERWLKSRRIDPQSAVIYESAWRLHVKPVFGRRSILAVKPSQVQTWLTQLGDTRGESTLVTAYLVLQGIFELAIADGQRKDNPARSPVVSKPSSHRRREKILAWADEVVNAVIDRHPDRLRLVAVLMAGCGLRVNEALAVSDDDFDFTGHVLHVRRQLKRINRKQIFSLPKNDSEREVPLPAWVETIALQHIRRFSPRPVSLPWEKVSGPLMTTVLLFTRDDGTYIRYADYRNGAWTPAIVRAGVVTQDALRHRSPETARKDRTGPHQFRHYYASVMLGDGGSIIDLADYLGHHDPAVTLRIYGHMQQKSHERAREIMDRRMFRPRAVAGGDTAE